MVYELMIQQEAQKNWKNLIGTMAPNCLRINGGDHSDVFSELDTWIQETLKDVSKPEDQPKDESPIPLPPATSLKGILDVLKTMAPQQSGTGGSEGGSGGGAQGTEGGGG